jgi:hypothetical protein
MNTSTLDQIIEIALDSSAD